MTSALSCLVSFQMLLEVLSQITSCDSFKKAGRFALFQEDPRTVWRREVLDPGGGSRAEAD